MSWLTYAFRILYLPIGIFGVAAGTVATTGLARRAAAGDMEGLRATLRRSLLDAGLPHPPRDRRAPGPRASRSCGSSTSAGAFGPDATEGTAAALAFYASASWPTRA